MQELSKKHEGSAEAVENPPKEQGSGGQCSSPEGSTPDTKDARVSASERSATGQARLLSTSRFTRTLLVLALYTILAGWLIYPAYADKVPRIIGGGELGGWLWRYWWMKLEIIALQLKYPGQPIEQFFNIVSLGRFPETGNIADLYAVSLPLDRLFGFPHYYNIKIFLILLTNALTGYVYTRYLTGKTGVALIAGMTLAANSFVFYEVERSGLRQAILCFMVLYIYFLDRALHERKTWLGIVAGVFFALTSAFYWFYGLFIAAYSVFRFGIWAWRRRRAFPLSIWKPLTAFVLVAPAVTLPFMVPYISDRFSDPGAAKLPEVSFFKTFPTLPELQNAPLRPNSPEENLLSSLARVLYSSWDPDWAFNPLQTWVVPIVMGLCAVLFSLFRWRRTGFWLFIFVLFYTLTWGPYLQYEDHFFLIQDRYAIRLPYWYAFYLVPMMSRLFAPYRMGSMVVISMSVLLALNFAALSNRMERMRVLRAFLALLFCVLYLGQFLVDPMRELGIGSNKKLPLLSSSIAIPEWYHRLAKEPGKIGIIELPVDRQQDLLTYYQTAHAKKIMGGWTSPGALPPVLRFDKHPKPIVGLLQWMALPDGLSRNSMIRALRRLGDSPYELAPIADKDRIEAYQTGYRYIVLHELGCYLLEPRWGKELYSRMKTQLRDRFGDPVEEFVEMPATDYDANVIPFQNGMPWIPSIYSPQLIPEPRPWDLHMVVYAIPGPQADLPPEERSESTQSAETTSDQAGDQTEARETSRDSGGGSTPLPAFDMKSMESLDARQPSQNRDDQ